MIYVVFDQSYEGDGYDGPSNLIRFITDDKEKAIEFFKTYYLNPPKSDKWFYRYRLLEYPDDYNYFLDHSKINLIMESTNGGDDEDYDE